MKERIYLFDTTLRDGQQTSGVDFSVADKQAIAIMLDELGVDYIEGGYPGANPTDTEFFTAPPKLQTACFTAFGMTKRAGRSVDNDAGFKHILQSQSEAICLVAKSWDYHVDIALEISLQENISTIEDSLAAIEVVKKQALIDCEHFFDGFKANRDYALQCAVTAYEKGARWIVLCDTNGGTMPDEVFEIVEHVKTYIPGTHLGIHAHNDTEQAVAVSLAALQAGVRQIQGTLNGLGERCGNANMLSLIPTLMLKPHYNQRFEINVPPEQLKNITRISRALDDILNRVPNAHAAYVGASAFVHKGGIHASAVAKDPATYEHVAPDLIGNQRRIPVSDQAGKSNIIDQLTAAKIKVEKNDSAIEHLLRIVKEKESIGYSYDGAGASFELLALSQLGRLPDYFEVNSYAVQIENEKDETVSTAHIALQIGAEKVENTAQGNGPVNALDQAFRKDLGGYTSYLKDMRLVDYRVRILNAGTAAVTRVTIESSDQNGTIWRTMGVHENIVIASFEALRDAVIYKLWRDEVRPQSEIKKSE